MSFKLWSEINEEALDKLKPDLGSRHWSELSEEEKYKVWKYLERHFFNSKIKHNFNHRKSDFNGDYYDFYGEGIGEEDRRRNRIWLSIITLNDKYKTKSYGKQFLEDSSLNNACRDFFNIFIREESDAVLELISLYCRIILLERKEGDLPRKEKEEEKNFRKRVNDWIWTPFSEFARDFNEVFGQFHINLYLTRSGLMPRQDRKIIEDVYEPVLEVFSDSRWNEVNQLLTDAFSEYRKHTEAGFSNSVTNAVAAVQAFLQLLVSGETGSGKISKLISQAQDRNLIPNDLFTKEVFSNIESILMRERQETGISHPKKQYASEENTLMVLNLCMIFFQHCLSRNA